MYGQELNPESYAICKADMLIKGQDVSAIVFGDWSAPHQTGQVTGVDDWLAVNSRGESMREPEWGWLVL